MRKYTFEEVMNRMGFIAEGEDREEAPTLHLLAKLGAIVMRLEERIKTLEEGKNPYNVKRKEKYINRKSSGICVECGKEDAVKGKAMCQKCLKRAKLRMRGWRQKNGEESKNQYRRLSYPGHTEGSCLQE